MPASVLGILKLMVITNLHIGREAGGYHLWDTKNPRFNMEVAPATVTVLIERGWIGRIDAPSDFYVATAEGRRFVRRVAQAKD